MSTDNLRIDTFNSGVYNSFIAMRITDPASGLYVEGQGLSKYKLKQRLIEELEEKIDNETGSIVIDGTLRSFFKPKI
jgi:predicted AAA+ superfamily ATPase